MLTKTRMEHGNVVREYGTEFDLVCENDLQVSCLHHIPDWLEPHQYIKDVYALRQGFSRRS